MKSIIAIFFEAVMWVQVPQWEDDWSKCAVDVPDASCHWYIVAPDNTFGEGFNWEIAPWFDAHGLGSLVWDLCLSFFGLEYLAWGLWLGIFDLGFSSYKKDLSKL